MGPRPEGEAAAIAATRRHVGRARAGGLLLAVLLAIFALAAPAGAQKLTNSYAVVVHRSTPVDELSLVQLRQIYLGEQQFWSGSERIALLLHAPGTRERAVALRLLYRMSESEFRRYWIARTFRHDAVTGPKIVSSTALAKKLVARIPGAIAVVPASEADVTVKVLRVDGRLPGTTGYPLVDPTSRD